MPEGETMTEQSFESMQQSVSADDLKAAWESEANQTAEQPEAIEPAEQDAEVVENEAVSEEAQPVEEQAEGEEPKAASAEPIILRKQNKKMRDQLRRLEHEMAMMRQQYQAPQAQAPTMSQDFVDPVTGEPLDESSVEGQVFKALNKVALVNQQKEAKQKAYLEQQRVMQMEAELYEKLDEASEKYPDFDEVVRADDVPITPVMKSFAHMLPNPAETFYAIAKDKTELMKLAKSPPEEQVRKMVEVSARILSKTQNGARKTPAKTITPLRNNPAARPASSVISDKSSVSDIRARIKNGWK